MKTKTLSRILGTLTLGSLVALAGCKSSDKGSGGEGEAATSQPAEGAEGSCGGDAGSCGGKDGSCGGKDGSCGGK